MKRRLLLLLMPLFLCGIPTLAHDIEVDGIYYHFATNKKEVSVFYKGDKYDSYSNEYSGDIVIPDSIYYNGKYYVVTRIENFAFYGCKDLTSITIPNTINHIGTSAFAGVTGLTSVSIPSSVTYIGRTAFSNCTGLTSITIPSSVTTIEYQAFYCPNLSELTLNSNEVVSRAYTSSSNLSNIFTHVKYLIIGEDVKSIGDYAFKDFKSLVSVTIPNSVTSIGSESFSGCKGLTSVTIPNSVTSIGGYAFYGCSGLTSVTIPNSVTSIGSGTFYGCTGLTSLTIPNSVTSIGSYAFVDCSGLTSVTIGNSVSSIGTDAFRGCSGLTSVTIPNSVTSIGSGAFLRCTNLYDLTLNSTDIVSKNNETVYFFGSQVMTLRIGDGVKSIGDYAFKDFKSLVSVTIPNSVTSIGRGSFYGCTGLTSVTIPNSVTSIGGFAFYGCSGLTSVTIPNSVTSIGDYAFEWCSGLTSVIIPNSVTTIEKGTFWECSGLTSVTFPNSVWRIGTFAFRDCTGLTSVIIPNSVTSIELEAFRNCSALTRIECHSITPPYCGTSVFENVNKQKCQLFVPKNSISAYQSANEWKDFYSFTALPENPLLKDMIELRIKSDSLITSYNSNNGGSTSGGTITNNVDSLSKAAFTTPPTGLLTSASQLSSNAKATNEGSYEALLDGNQTTYFHTTWLSGKGDAPNEDHYLQIDLQEEVERIALKYGARGSITNYVNPNNITIYATNNVNGNWTQITTATLTYDNNSNGKGLLSIDLGGKYRYIRISVQSSTLSSSRTINGHSYWCLGELRIYNIGTGSQEGTGTEPQGNDEKPQVPKEVVENLQNCINAAGTEISTNAATQSTYDALLSAYNTFLSYMNESTDVERIYTNPSVDVWYDLQGRRITKPQTPGIYIHNGKKVWVK